MCSVTSPVAVVVVANLLFTLFAVTMAVLPLRDSVEMIVEEYTILLKTGLVTQSFDQKCTRGKAKGTVTYLGRIRGRG